MYYLSRKDHQILTTLSATFDALLQMRTLVLQNKEGLLEKSFKG
jgi:hypothetical protein